MKLTFAVQQGGAVAEITISLSAGGCATPFDLADMSDEIKLALAPQLAQLSERMSAAHIAALKEQALDEGMSFSARRRAQIKYQDLTGEELPLLNAPSFPRDRGEVSRTEFNRGVLATGNSADLSLIDQHLGQSDALPVDEHHDVLGVPDRVPGDVHRPEEL